MAAVLTGPFVAAQAADPPFLVVVLAARPTAPDRDAGLAAVRDSGAGTTIETIRRVPPLGAAAFPPQATLSVEYSAWLEGHPRAPLTILHQRAIAFSYATEESRDQALAAARVDPSVADAFVPRSGFQTWPDGPRAGAAFVLLYIQGHCENHELNAYTPEYYELDIGEGSVALELLGWGSYCLPIDPYPYRWHPQAWHLPGLAAGAHAFSVSLRTPWDNAVINDAHQFTVTVAGTGEDSGAARPIPVLGPICLLVLVLLVPFAAVARGRIAWRG